LDKEKTTYILLAGVEVALADYFFYGFTRAVPAHPDVKVAPSLIVYPTRWFLLPLISSVFEVHHVSMI